MPDSDLADYGVASDNDPKSIRAYLLKDSFQLLRTYETIHWATWFLQK